MCFDLPKGISFMKKIALITAALLVVACSSTPKSDSTAAQAKATQATDTTAPATTAASAPAPVTAEKLALDKLNAELQALQNQSSFFDTAKYAIKPEFEDVLKKHAEFLKAHSSAVVTLEGNADERGTDEYNQKLGEKRAKAVKKTLVKLGVPSKQIKVVSYGESRPRQSCHEEKCWKENRRVDFGHRA
jgi:peptidoglycan-associated lipoprotein